MLITQIKDELELLESLDFKRVNKEQRNMLKDKYKFHTVGFEYAQDDWGNVIFICANDTLENMQYFIGLEYDREHIEYQFRFNGKNIISYNGSDRADKLYDNLHELEN